MRDPLTIEAFTDWLGRQPKKKPYNPVDNKRCAICQYFDRAGIKYKEVRGVYWIDGSRNRRKIPDGFNDVALLSPYTFGAAHARAVAILEGAP